MELVNSYMLYVSTSDTSIRLINNTISSPTGPIKINFSNKIFGYLPEWGIYDLAYMPSLIPANKLTHILYSFLAANPTQEDYNILAANYHFPI